MPQRSRAHLVMGFGEGTGRNGWPEEGVELEACVQVPLHYYWVHH